jgi:hypothetical protein
MELLESGFIGIELAVKSLINGMGTVIGTQVHGPTLGMVDHASRNSSMASKSFLPYTSKPW